MEDTLSNVPTQNYLNKDKKLNRKFLLLVIVLMAAILLLALNYFGILPFSNLSKLSSKTQNDINQSTKNPSFSDVKTNQDISAVSDVTGYKISFTNKERLKSYVTKISLWGKTYNDLANPVVLQNIEFHLSNDNPRPENLQKDQNGNPLYSYNLLFINNTLKLYIYLYPNVLVSENNAKTFTNAAITITSQLSSSGKGGKSLSQDEINKITTEFANENFFRLQKGT